MQVQNVLKTDSLENVINGKFVFCKELKKGFIKGELSTLSLSDYSFENVATVIESLTLEELESKGLNTVIFVNGEEKISQRMNLEVEAIIAGIENPTTELLTTLLNNKRTKSDYFDENFIQNSVDGLVIDGLIAHYSLSSDSVDSINGFNGIDTNVTYDEHAIIGTNDGDGIQSSTIISQINTNSDITISCNINSGSLDSSAQLLLCGVYSHNATNKGERFTLGTLNNKIAVNRFWSVSFNEPASSILDGEWHKVVVVAEHGIETLHYSLYIDNVYIETILDPDITSLSLVPDIWVNIGKGQSDGLYNFKGGLIKDVLIYNKSLNSELQS